MRKVELRNTPAYKIAKACLAFQEVVTEEFEKKGIDYSKQVKKLDKVLIKIIDNLTGNQIVK